MPTREILRDEWGTFFDGFSRAHEGWLVTIEVLDPDLGAQTEAGDLALRGLTVDLKQTGDIISIDVGKTPQEHVTHSISNPTHVWLQETEQGAHEALEIQTASGTTTLVRFRETALPEMVDGVIEEPRDKI